MKKTLVFFIGMLLLACNNEKDETETPVVEKTGSMLELPGDFGIGEKRYVDMTKTTFGHLASGDVDQWTEAFADQALYRWNNFDSLNGKAAIGDYWKKRFAENIEKLDFTHEIYLPIKVNNPVENIPKTGTYVMVWNVVTGKYKTGKMMTQRVHTVIHYDAQDKIDYLSQYLDRVPIAAASK